MNENIIICAKVPTLPQYTLDIARSNIMMVRPSWQETRGSPSQSSHGSLFMSITGKIPSCNEGVLCMLNFHMCLKNNSYFIKYDWYSYVPFVCSYYYIADTVLYLYVIGIVRQYKPSLASALPGMFNMFVFLH